MTADLKSLLRQAIADHPGKSPAEIAFIVAENAPMKLLRGFLAQALVDMARNAIGERRRDSLDGAVGENPSPKLRDRASWWTRMLAERVNVNGRWIVLGECTYDDLQACIDDREKLIGRIHGQIENYKRLQKLMAQHGAKTVSDVPAQTEWTTTP